MLVVLHKAMLSQRLNNEDWVRSAEASGDAELCSILVRRFSWSYSSGALYTKFVDVCVQSHSMMMMTMATDVDFAVVPNCRTKGATSCIENVQLKSSTWRIWRNFSIDYISSWARKALINAISTLKFCHSCPFNFHEFDSAEFRSKNLL